MLLARYGDWEIGRHANHCERNECLMDTLADRSTNGQRSLDPNAVERALRALAAEHPNRVTGGSEFPWLYTNWDGSPGCLLGHMLERLGLPRPAYDDTENGNIFVPGSMGLWLQTHGVEVPPADDDVWFHLRWIQVAQDEGHEWADAVELSLGQSEYPPEPAHMGDLV